MNDQFFKRTEKKYILTPGQQHALLEKIQDRMTLDSHGEKIITSLYFDTDSYDFIRRSLEKPVYKEKLRMRGYGAVRSESEVYLELKKKYKGVVYKRRQAMTLSQAREYLQTGIPPLNSQIMREIDWTLKSHPTLSPKASISYDRLPLYCKANQDLRMTFDKNLLYRGYDLDLQSGPYGLEVLEDDRRVLEIKCSGGMPLWLTQALDSLSLYPQSFSKYGTAYQKYVLSSPASVSDLIA